ncbi:MAG TPA: LacI family DNA-binding transcriptional regulator [Candidatus Dormibacteraeota bacterium]|nr:LacI family DNA-binding transcriptional regulator [Candidatus Dormibacteraeota bacterium]
MRDVARRAGVSHQTVSRVINGEDTVAPATRDRVRRAIRELEYVPSAIARSLSSDRTHTLGMVTTDISDHFFAEAVVGAEAEARKHGLFLIIGTVEEAASDDEGAYLRLMLEQRIDGLVIARPRRRVAGDALLRRLTERVPVVEIASDVAVPSVEVVDVDNRQGGLDATNLLIERGHRAIATVTGPLDWPSAQARLEGYRESLRRAKLAETASLIASGKDWGLESGEHGATRLLDGGKRFTAVFAQSDLLALGAIACLRRRGLRVPEDVSVVGYDDIPVAAFVDPPLTTVRQPMREVGALAVRLIVERTGRDRAAAHRHLLRAPVIERKSVAPPAVTALRA